MTATLVLLARLPGGRVIQAFSRDFSNDRDGAFRRPQALSLLIDAVEDDASGRPSTAGLGSIRVAVTRA
jgi:hypothetical protein